MINCVQVQQTIDLLNFTKINFFQNYNKLSSEEIKKRENDIDLYENEFINQNCEKNFRLCGVSGKQLEYSFENYNTQTLEQVKFKEKMLLYYDDIINNKPRTICLLGKCGIGKTHLSISMLHKLFHEKKDKIYEFDIFYNGKYELSSNLCEHYYACKRFNSKETQEDYINSLSVCDLLVIDEISRTGKTDDEKNLLFRIIDARYVNRKSTILISNLDATSFEQYLGEATMDRLKSSAVCPNLNNFYSSNKNESYRINEFRN